MAITEKAKEKLDEAGKEIKAAVDGLAEEVSRLSERVKEKLKGGSEEVKEVAEMLAREVKDLSEKVKTLIPKQRMKHRIPVHRIKEQGYHPESADLPLAEFRREVDSLFSDFFRQFDTLTNIRGGYQFPRRNDMGSSWPQIDISDTDESLVITTELPGVDKNDIEILVDKHRITIRGEKRREEEKKGHDFYHVERYYGTFHRSLPLPLEVEPDKVNAAFKNGVLTVTVPKPTAARERFLRIPVRKGK